MAFRPKKTFPKNICVIPLWENHLCPGINGGGVAQDFGPYGAAGFVPQLKGGRKVGRSERGIELSGCERLAMLPPAGPVPL